MGSDEAKEIYKQRATTAECVNAQARNRGQLRMPVRGLAKVRSVVGLFVLAHNLMRMAVLAPQIMGWGNSPSATAAQAALEVKKWHKAPKRAHAPSPLRQSQPCTAQIVCPSAAFALNGHWRGVYANT